MANIVNLIFKNSSGSISADMSEILYSQILPSKDGGFSAISLSVEVAWPSTGSPVGSFDVLWSNHGTADSGGVPTGSWAVYDSESVVEGPTGTSGSLFFRGIPIGQWGFTVIRYTPTSGGSGASLTDASGMAGAKPKASFEVR